MVRDLVRVLLPVAVLLASGVSCDSDDDSNSGPVPTYTLSGVFIKSGVADGVRGYAKLVAPGAPDTTPALYFVGSAPFSGGTAAYSLSGIARGSYYGYAFIDVNGNATGGATSMPDAGDWVTDGPGPVTIVSDTTINTPENAWVPFQ